MHAGLTDDQLAAVSQSRRVAAQLVERSDDRNDNGGRLFATPGEGLNR